MTISDFLALCKKKLYLIIIFPIVFGLVAAVFCWGVLTNNYTSTVPLYVLHKVYTDPRYGLSSADITASQQIANDVTVLVKSSKVYSAVMEELGLESLADYDINVSGSDKNRVINLSVTGKNPRAVAEVVNCFARKTSSLAVEVMNVEGVNIIEEAQPSSTPSGPPRSLYTLVATFAGLLVSIVIIVLEDMLDTTIKNKDDLEKTLELPVLAQVPYSKTLKA